MSSNGNNSTANFLTPELVLSATTYVCVPALKLYYSQINLLNTDGNIECYSLPIAILTARQRTEHAVPEGG